MARTDYRSGFTMIELLSAMTVLVFIVMLMSRLFGDASQVWRLESRRTITAMEGRAVMDFLVKELTQAIADDVVSFRINSGSPRVYGVPAYGADSDEMFFTALVRSGNSGRWKRNANQFAYFIAPMLNEKDEVMPNRYRLARTRRTESVFSSQTHRDRSAYNTINWWREMKPNSKWLEEGNIPGEPGSAGCETIAENVAAFEVWAYSESGNRYVFDYFSHTGENQNMLPLWLDIYLELLSEEDAIRMADLWAVNEVEAKEYLSRNVKRFTTRVFFPNRERARAFRQ